MFYKEEWKDRDVQFPNRFTKSAETSSDVTLTANPGTVTEIGTAISANKMNRIEDGIFNANLLAYMGGF
jgi:hypothetical protein